MRKITIFTKYDDIKISVGLRSARPNNPDVSKELKWESPFFRRGFNNERVMMPQVIILIVLLAIIFAAC
ncbi:hypothetical protein DOA99_06055 [Salmonella enterica subsp. houtenae]|nr:hypothetical protein [Salmonella enterica subsp. houtenae]ECI3631417.1 hypothetical protein [Salmonella enterica subsp. houtenae]ECI3708247.1 hypothetical protein [Salmonella enterica subsp. houtenae]MLR84373.1 hypothetical protein [Salmonella enterica subsp. houtenae]